MERTFSHLRFREFPPYKSSNQEVWHLPDEIEPLKLDWNESALPPSPKAMDAIEKLFSRPNTLNWYPDADSLCLRDALAAHWQINRNNVQTYCGSDSALESVVKVFTRKGDGILMLSPTYDNFRIYSIEAECDVNLDGPENVLVLTAQTMEQLLERHKPHFVYLANPNNPTGWLVAGDEIAGIAERHPDVMFLIDEAYGEFSGQTVIPLAASRANVAVVRTFSKAYGLAGLRIGYVVASSGNIAELNHVRIGKNVSMIGQVAAVAALEDQKYLQLAMQQIREGGKILAKGLSKLGITHHSTPANFMLMKVRDPKAIQNTLAAEHIYVRSMSHLKGMDGYLRVTLGNPAQMKRLLAAIMRSLNRTDL